MIYCLKRSLDLEVLSFEFQSLSTINILLTLLSSKKKKLLSSIAYANMKWYKFFCSFLLYARQ